MNRKILLKAMLCLLPFIAYAQNDRQALAAKDTRKGYDLRGQGFNAALQFVHQDPNKFPVMIGVATKDEKFMAAVIKIIQEMDRAGYEDLGLMYYDTQNTPNRGFAIHEVMFFKDGKLTGMILKYDTGWYFASVGADNKRAIAPIECTEEYPLTLIRTKIRTTHAGSKGRSYTNANEN